MQAALLHHATHKAGGLHLRCLSIEFLAANSSRGKKRSFRAKHFAESNFREENQALICPRGVYIACQGKHVNKKSCSNTCLPAYLPARAYFKAITQHYASHFL